MKIITINFSHYFGIFIGNSIQNVRTGAPSGRRMIVRSIWQEKTRPAIRSLRGRSCPIPEARNDNIQQMSLRGATQLRRGSLFTQPVTPMQGACPTVESRRRKRGCRAGLCRQKWRFSRRGRWPLLRMTGQAYRPPTYSPTGFFTPHGSIQNDRTMDIISKELCALFRQKALVAVPT